MYKRFYGIVNFTGVVLDRLIFSHFVPNYTPSNSPLLLPIALGGVFGVTLIILSCMENTTEYNNLFASTAVIGTVLANIAFHTDHINRIPTAMTKIGYCLFLLVLSLAAVWLVVTVVIWISILLFIIFLLICFSAGSGNKS